VPEGGWHCPRREDLILRDWPDGTVVFDDASGQLQCLSPLFGTLMALLVQPRAWRTADLAMALLGEEPICDDVQMVENALAEFSALNLIERAVV
jgi:hypothetical protein